MIFPHLLITFEDPQEICFWDYVERRGVARACQGSFVVAISHDVVITTHLTRTDKSKTHLVVSRNNLALGRPQILRPFQLLPTLSFQNQVFAHVVFRFTEVRQHIESGSLSELELSFIDDVHMRRWGTFFAHDLASDTISLLKSHN